MTWEALSLVLVHVGSWVDCFFTCFAAMGLLNLCWVRWQKRMPLLTIRTLGAAACLALVILDGFRAHWDGTHTEHFPLPISWPVVLFASCVLGTTTFRLAKLEQAQPLSTTPHLPL